MSVGNMLGFASSKRLVMSTRTLSTSFSLLAAAKRLALVMSILPLKVSRKILWASLFAGSARFDTSRLALASFCQNFINFDPSKANVSALVKPALARVAAFRVFCTADNSSALRTPCIAALADFSSASEPNPCAPATALPPTRVTSVPMVTTASSKPEAMLYAFEPGVNTTLAAPRPTVQAEPLIVPRTRLARSACFSAALPPKNHPSPDSSESASIVPNCVDLNQPSNPAGSFSLKICEATLFVTSFSTSIVANDQREAVLTLSNMLRSKKPLSSGLLGSNCPGTRRACACEAALTVEGEALPLASDNTCPGVIHGD